MKFFNAIAAAAVIGTSFISIPARASSGCYPAHAAQVMSQVMRGGGSFELAAMTAAEEGYAIATKACWYRIKSQLEIFMSY